MATSHKESNGTHITPQNKKSWNISCDTETHEALDLLGEWMVGKEKLPQELKVKVSKTNIVKTLALEKLRAIGLLDTKKKSGVANN
jgi:hypothetical protein